MHADHAAFLRAIRAAPDDDLPRLVYADYLDERGDPRGEFIRLQIERPRLPRDDPRRAELKAREDELLREHRAEWEGPLEDIVSGVIFRRGFIDDVLVMAEKFLPSVELLFAWAPITSLRLKDTAGHLRAIMARPELAGLTALELCYDDLEAREAAVIAASPHLGRLRELNLNYNRFGDAGVAALASSPALGNLEILHLEDCDLTARAGATLAASTLKRLRALELSDNKRFGAAGAAALTIAPFLKRFTTLDLSDTGLGDAGAARLADASSVVGLTRLRLGYNSIRDAGASALARSPHLRSLAVLDLNGNAIGDAGAAAILDARHLRGLARLELSVNPLSRAMRQRLDEAFGERWG